MMNFLYYDDGEWVWGLRIAMGLAMLVVWGIISWAVVSIIRHKEAHGDGGPQTSPSADSNLFLMTNTREGTSSKETAQQLDPRDTRRPDHCVDRGGAGHGSESTAFITLNVQSWMGRLISVPALDRVGSSVVPIPIRILRI
jgi:hypothetical protein